MIFEYTFLGVFIAVFFYLPGLIFKKFYFRGPFSKQFGWGNVTEKFISGVFLGLLMHFILGLSIYLLWHNKESSANHLFKSYKNIKAAFVLTVTEGKRFTIQISDLKAIIEYWVLSICLSAIFSYILYRIVKLFKLDINFKFFRFANHWNYYFRGSILHEKKFRNTKEKWVGTIVDVLMNTSDGNILYSGILSNYELSHKECNLELLYLTNTQRYRHPKKNPGDPGYDENIDKGGFKDIPGHFLIIPYKQAYNINVRYVLVKRENGDRNKIKWYHHFQKRIRLLLYISTLIISLFLFGRLIGKVAILRFLSVFPILFLDVIAIVSLVALISKKGYVVQGKVNRMVLIIGFSILFLILITLTLLIIGVI